MRMVGVTVETAHMVVKCLYRDRLWRRPNKWSFSLRTCDITYGGLIRGFCDVGDLIGPPKFGT